MTTLSSTPQKAGQATASAIADGVRRLAELRALFARPAAPVPVSRLAVESVDVDRLPSSLVVVTPNYAAIEAAYVEPWRPGRPLPCVPGLKFKIV